MWRTHSCVLIGLTLRMHCEFNPDVETSLDAARKSACATAPWPALRQFRD